MNFFGLNRAALNGSAVSIIAGAALVSAIVSASADATIIKSGGTTTIAPAITVSATGTRMAGGAALVNAQGSIAPVQWSLVFSASANIYAGASVIATPTATYSATTSSGQASGQITRPGEALSSSSALLSITPLVTVGYAANINSSVSVQADPSVKLNGSSLWQRDGYAQTIATTALVTASPLKTALGYASAYVLSSAIADGIKTHGGAANIVGSCSIQATASIDSATAYCTSNVTANGFVTQFSDATASTVSQVLVSGTNTKQAEPLIVECFTSAYASGRLAITASASISGLASISEDGRTAQLGECYITPTSFISASGTKILFGASPVYASSSASAVGTIIKSGASLIQPVVTVAALGETNATVRAPTTRTARTPQEIRLMKIPYENRSMKVPK